MKYAMFEAIHGSAPRRAGQNLANPSGLLLGSVMMLLHINQTDIAERVHNAWLRTIEDGIHTYDIFKEGLSQEKVGTREFAKAVAARLGQRPEKLKPVAYNDAPPQTATQYAAESVATLQRDLVGVDLFVYHQPGEPNKVGALVEALNGDGLKLSVISSRGVKVYPNPLPDTITGDSWRCRFVSSTANEVIEPAQIISLLSRTAAAGLSWSKTEHLYNFGGKPGFSAIQGH